jgi:4-hydroxybenzoate polyprenyltransferase
VRLLWRRGDRKAFAEQPLDKKAHLSAGFREIVGFPRDRYCAIGFHRMVAPRESQAAQAPAAPADAVARNWVNVMPHVAQPYLRLMRLDRPIGIWLLFLPCVFGLVLGEASQARVFGSQQDIGLVLLFALGSVVMRGAGCTFNDIVDRDIDAAVARTRARPIPSGAVSLRAAWIFLAIQCAIGLVILLQLNWLSIALGVASLIPVAIYPYMKRITWWPQAWLGLTFNWGALLGFSAAANTLRWSAVLLYAACFFWTLGYDTIYAHQDKEDDALLGVKSTARLFGERSRPWIALFYLIAVSLWAWAILKEEALPAWTIIFLLPAAGQLFWQVQSLDIQAPANCLRVFRSNRDGGLLLAAAFIAATLFTP